MTTATYEGIVDPIIGKRHPYYLGPWKDGNKEVTGVFCHEGENPSRPIFTYEDGDEAFKLAYKLNNAARQKNEI